MVAISQVRVLFTGAAVIGPAMSAVYTTGDPLTCQVAWKTFWDSLKGALPPALTMTIPNTGETYEDSTGAMVSVWTEGTTGNLAGIAGAPSFARGVGARAVWSTNGVTNGRRVRGTTFLVPLAASSYESDGTINASTLVVLRDAVTAFVAATATDLTIWTRPILGAGGKTSGVTGGTVPDAITTLRSRRV